jgi:hypothetical protein
LAVWARCGEKIDETKRALTAKPFQSRVTFAIVVAIHSQPAVDVRDSKGKPRRQVVSLDLLNSGLGFVKALHVQKAPR